MARTSTVALLLVLAVAAASAQDIVDNLYPKNGEVCKDYGDQWKNITLGTCEKGTKCQAYKRGVFKCVSTDPAKGSLPIGTVCYDENKVDQANRAEGEQWRKYYRERNCEFQGLDAQGTPLVQCIQTSDPKIYKCGKILPLYQKGCFTVAGSEIWGKWNDNQMYDACNGCPCTNPAKTKCKSGPCKYPLCHCDEECTPERQKLRCPTA